MTMWRAARLLGAIALAVAATACGGGGGGSSDGGTTGGPQTGSFVAADSTPPADSVSLQAGTHSGLAVNVNVVVTSVDDFFGTGFRVVYDPTVAQYQSFDAAGSFLRDAPFNKSCAKTVRLRNVGSSPIVANAIAPDFMNTRRFISVSSSTTLEFRCAQREADDLLQSLQVNRPAKARKLHSRKAFTGLLRFRLLTCRASSAHHRA